MLCLYIADLCCCFCHFYWILHNNNTLNLSCFFLFFFALFFKLTIWPTNAVTMNENFLRTTVIPFVLNETVNTVLCVCVFKWMDTNELWIHLFRCSNLYAVARSTYVCWLLLGYAGLCFLPGGLPSHPLFSLPKLCTGEGSGEKVGQMNKGSQTAMAVLQHASPAFSGCYIGQCSQYHNPIHHQHYNPPPCLPFPSGTLAPRIRRCGETCTRLYMSLGHWNCWELSG